VTIDQLVDGVYRIDMEAEEEPYRAFLFDGETPTLFDAGSEGTVPQLCNALEELDVEPERLIITHADFDHIGGFDTIVEAYDPETWVPQESIVETTTVPDNRFEHGESIGDFVAVHVPGHKPDNYAFVDEDDRIAVLGDVMIGSDRRGLPTGYFVMVEAVYSEDLIAAERYLERLLQYDFEVGLVSHGSSVMNGARDKIAAYITFPGNPEWPEE